MATESQLNANRKNGLASTGPRTPEGTAVSSANATKHGLSAGFRVFPNENQQEFDELVAEYHRTFAPTAIHEQFFVEEMAQARWRLARFRRLETAVIDQMIGLANAADGDFILAAAFINNTAGPIKTLQRCAADAERSYYRALRQLEACRKQDAADADAAEKPAVRNEPNSRPPSASGHANGAPLASGNPFDDGGWKM
ncbi:MAG: hypothetical protein ABSH47_17135 [Bryobacteraceae bacterium]|jgi:hypothetical protein